MRTASLRAVGDGCLVCMQRRSQRQEEEAAGQPAGGGGGFVTVCLGATAPLLMRSCDIRKSCTNTSLAGGYRRFGGTSYLPSSGNRNYFLKDIKNVSLRVFWLQESTECNPFWSRDYYRTCICNSCNGSRAAGGKDDRSLQFNAGVTNVWSYISIPLHVFIAWFLIRYESRKKHIVCLRQWSLKCLAVPLGAVESPRGEALEVVPSGGVFLLFTIEAISRQTLGNWYHFIKPIHRIKNLLTVK
jgi:hypothetical protein